jgi:hypothetical protein
MKLDQVNTETSGKFKLEYARPVKRKPLHGWRVAMMSLALCLPPLAGFLWASLGTEWLVAQPWFRSGNPIEAKYSPIFIDRPFWICTALYWIEGAFVLDKVLRHRWNPRWLIVVPLMFALWVMFVAGLLNISERVFP